MAGSGAHGAFCAERCINQGPRNGIYLRLRHRRRGRLGAYPADMLQWWLDNAGIPNMPLSCEAKGVIPTTGLFNTLTHWDAHFVYPLGVYLGCPHHAFGPMAAKKPSRFVRRRIEKCLFPAA